MTEQEINTGQSEVQQEKHSSRGRRKLLIGLVIVVLVVAAGYWIFTRYLFPTSFTPVELSQQEQQQLDKKLNQLGIATQESGTANKREPLTPEPYRERDADREIFFTEKELNALLAHNTDLANKLAIDLSDNLASAKLLIDLDPDLPVLGGKTLKVTAGMELRLGKGKPVAILKGISVWGVPLPNAWLGNLKNIDLIKEFGDAGGFWQAINQGVEEMEITEGKLRIKLKK